MTKQLLPVVMTDQFIRIAVIDDYSSFIWSSRYYTTGDFQLIVDATPEDMSLFKEQYYIVRDDDENVGIIENIFVERTEDGNDRLIIKGRFIDSVIGRRIIAEQTTVSGKISDCIEQLLDENIINPSNAARQIDNFIIDSYEVATAFQAQYTGKNLLETISAICETYGIGYKVTLNADHEFVFKLYEGVDRTYDQNVNDWVIFSDTYDNLISSEYEENYQKVVTSVLVAGEGEGLDRKTAWVGDDKTGLERYEVYKDQRNIRSNDGEIPEEEYIELLKEAGKESLTKYTTAFTGKVYFENIKYKTDIGLGDLCVIQNDNWGIYINSRLVEVIESVDETGAYTITPTFGK